ncbi:hypothetical protein UFOVP1244_9 [uncultured Caudovirales phage]|uniref:Uncharacterized protein n=1 Tax=uncultured Caudovirales phage TaxID=2100421 RepID=A0A6J5R5J0_9CAUD|nr:hypothetical protein UFOVP1244_9 [uncultured Caudovirales phage]
MRFWATPEEAHIIRSKSRELGYTEVADFIRTQALTKKSRNMSPIIKDACCSLSKLADRLIFEARRGDHLDMVIMEIRTFQDGLVKK